jgi:hypothetical protein
LAQAFGWFNPHLDLTVDWEGERIACPASKPDWKKWRPSNPTSAHWYSEARLRRLMAAKIVDGQDHNREPRFVRAFIGEFRNLSGSAKKQAVLEAAGAARMTLPDFFESGSVADLLAAMKANSSPVQPKDLGEIGRDHLAACFNANGVDPETFQYKRIYRISEGLPYVVEAAFGYRPKGDGLVIVSGINWSPVILNPFRQLGHFESLDSILTAQRCGYDEPLAFALHLSCPLPGFVDHGKGSIAPDWRVANDIKDAVLAITKKWCKQRKAEERDASARANRRARLMASSNRVTVKDAAYEIMERAYLKASTNGTLPANARQVMYAARAYIQEQTGEQLDAQYFIQQLLPDYINEHDVDWDVVFDDRGHFREPHTKRRFGLGGIAVREYLAGIGGPTAPKEPTPTRSPPPSRQLSARRKPPARGPCGRSPPRSMVAESRRRAAGNGARSKSRTRSPASSDKRPHRLNFSSRAHRAKKRMARFAPRPLVAILAFSANRRAALIFRRLSICVLYPFGSF